MNIQELDETILKLEKINYKLDLLLKKGGNDENLVSKRRELLKKYFQLKKELNDERVL
jgi:hypothetical protein